MLSAGSIFDKSAFSLAKHFHLARVDWRPVLPTMTLQLVVLLCQFVHDANRETVFLPLNRLLEDLWSETVKPNGCDLNCYAFEFIKVLYSTKNF